MKENEKPSKIEETKQSLYDRNSDDHTEPRHGVLHQINFNVDKNWGKESNTMAKKNNTTFFKKFFIATIIFFVFAIAFASYMFLRGSTSVSNDNIEISVLGNAFTEGGKELPLQIEIINKNKADLEYAYLIIEHPRGASDDASDVVRLPKESIGTIKAGSRIEKLSKVVLYGDRASVRNIKIKLEYHPAGSNAIFTKEKDYPVTINSSPISLLFDAPENVSANQTFNFNIRANLNTTLPSGDTVVYVSYPPGFIYEGASIEPVSGKDTWSLSGITTNDPFLLNVSGRMAGQDGDDQSFHVYIGSKRAGRMDMDVVYNSYMQTVSIVKPFLDAKILVNGSDSENPSVSGGEKVNVEIEWANNTNSVVSDAQVIARLSGNALDKSKVSSNFGFYDSINNQIVWDKNSIRDFSSVGPGENGRLYFSFSPVPMISAGNRISNPQVSIDVSIRGRQAELGGGFVDVNNFSKKVIKISSDFQIANNISYISGNLPPKAENPTKYKISWILSNSINPIGQAEARAVLPPYVKWDGRLSGNTENISYVESTREVVWRIGNVSANTGFGVANREADFVISLIPSVSQVGSTPDVVGEIRLSGRDSYSDAIIRSTRPATNTFLRNDPYFKSGDERVIK